IPGRDRRGWHGALATLRTDEQLPARSSPKQPAVHGNDHAVANSQAAGRDDALTIAGGGLERVGPERDAPKARLPRNSSGQDGRRFYTGVLKAPIVAARASCPPADPALVSPHR